MFGGYLSSIVSKIFSLSQWWVTIIIILERYIKARLFTEGFGRDISLLHYFVSCCSLNINIVFDCIY